MNWLDKHLPGVVQALLILLRWPLGGLFHPRALWY